MNFLYRLKTMRRLFIFVGVLLLVLLVVILFKNKFQLTISDGILLVTALLVAWYAFETLALVELTRIKDQPFIEIEFCNGGSDVFLKNLGLTPAYSPSVSSLKIGDDTFDFDPLYTSRLPISHNEQRKLRMCHGNEKTGEHFVVDSTAVLRDTILNYSQGVPLKIVLTYFDKDGIAIARNLFIKTGGAELVPQKQYLYVSTSSK